MRYAINNGILFQTLRVELVREGPVDNYSVRCSEDICRVMNEEVSKLDRECFWVIPLTTKNHVIGINLVSMGSLNASTVHPREVFKPVILANAAAIVLVHNHPSGDPTPSQEDRLLTGRLKDAGELLGIRVLDHIVIGDKVHCSMKEAGYM